MCVNAVCVVVIVKPLERALVRLLDGIRRLDAFESLDDFEDDLAASQLLFSPALALDADCTPAKFRTKKRKAKQSVRDANRAEKQRLSEAAYGLPPGALDGKMLLQLFDIVHPITNMVELYDDQMDADSNTVDQEDW